MGQLNLQESNFTIVEEDNLFESPSNNITVSEDNMFKQKSTDNNGVIFLYYSCGNNIFETLDNLFND